MMLLHVWTRALLLAALRSHWTAIITMCPVEAHVFPTYETSLDWEVSEPIRPGDMVLSDEKMPGSLMTFLTLDLPKLEDEECIPAARSKRDDHGGH
jgi:hypothetical protein